MKQNFYLFFGGLLLISLSVFNYSCKKSLEDNFIKDSDVSGDLLNAAKEWHLQTTQTGNLLSNKATTVLLPTWKNAALNKLSNGRIRIVVPSPEFRLDPKSNSGFVRKLVFDQEGGKITGGMIIEIFSTSAYINENKNSLIERYTNGTLNDLNGSVFLYDVNYRYLRSFNYKDGKIVDATANIGLKGANASEQKLPKSTIKTLSCHDMYWHVTYSDGRETWDYLYTWCDASGEGHQGGYGPPPGGTPGPPPPQQEPPCPGDIFKNMQIARSNAVNINGGRFGLTRVDKKTHLPRMHKGLDIYARPNTQVYAAFGGVVTRAVGGFASTYYGSASDFGNLVEIESTVNGETFKTLYGHLNSVSVAVNQQVTQGQEIGSSGRTGNAQKGFSPHVHLQINKNGVKVNPENYIATHFNQNGTSTGVPCP